MGHIIAFSNQKGGVGKTTLAFNIGKELISKNKKVLFIDNDPQANLTMSFFREELPKEIVDLRGANISNSYQLYSEDINVEPFHLSEKIHIVGATKHLAEIASKPFEVSFNFKTQMDRLKKSYDFIIIDCVPSFGILQSASHMTADHLIVPTHLSEFSTKGIDALLQTVKKTKTHLNQNLNILGIIINEASGSRLLVDEHFEQDLKDNYKQLLFKIKITKSAKIKESCALGQSIREYQPSSNQAKQFKLLTDEVLQKIKITEQELAEV